MSLTENILAGVMLSAVLSINVAKAQSQKVSAISTAIPIVFTHGIDTSKAKAGDPVTAKTTQIVTLADGSVIPSGATVLGHVTASRPFSFDPTPYAAQEPSVLSIHFDTLQTKNGTTEVRVWMRALADRVASQNAITPHHVDEERDVVGYMVQIGGDSFRRDEKLVFSPDGDVVEYNRKEGVFARLLPGEYSSGYSHFQCEGSGVIEESVAIFSANACGLYGFEDQGAYLAENGQGGELGTFRLVSRHHTIKLYPQSTALLQTIAAPERISQKSD